MKQKKNQPIKKLYQGLNFKALKWCIENDFQVYIVPKVVSGGGVHTQTKHCRIAVRRGGITTEGKDFLMVNGRKVSSVETISDAEYKTQKEAFDHFNYVYEYLMKKYS